VTDFDRYDVAISLLIGVVADAALIIGAPLWALVAILMVGCCVLFIRHIDEFRVK
jgi:hypothetical protein